MDDQINSEHQDGLHAERLLRAADLLLAARGQARESDAFVDAWVGSTEEGAGRPGFERPFSYEELVEGMCFLIRCGFVEPSTSSSGSKPRRD